MVACREEGSSNIGAMMLGGSRVVVSWGKDDDLS